MKTHLKTFNSIALFIPIFFCLLGLIAEGFLMLAVLSTMITGFIQIIIGISYWIKFPNSIHIKIYFLVVIIFFLLLFFKTTYDWIWFLPPVLCIYISILIYSIIEKP